MQPHAIKRTLETNLNFHDKSLGSWVRCWCLSLVLSLVGPTQVLRLSSYFLAARPKTPM